MTEHRATLRKRPCFIKHAAGHPTQSASGAMWLHSLAERHLARVQWFAKQSTTDPPRSLSAHLLHVGTQSHQGEERQTTVRIADVGLNRAAHPTILQTFAAASKQTHRNDIGVKPVARCPPTRQRAHGREGRFAAHKSHKWRRRKQCRNRTLLRRISTLLRPPFGNQASYKMHTVASNSINL